MTLLWDPLFREPFLVGFVLAPLAAVLGCWLRLRGEWLATLAYAHVAGAGGVLGAVFHWPLLPAATTASLLAGVAKGLLSRAGNEVFGVMMLLGWCAALLLAANHPRADLVGRLFLDGQILFTGREHLWAASGIAALVAVVMPWLSHRLLRQSVQPLNDRVNGRRAWSYALVFDALVMVVVAACALAMGVMAAFALVMIPAWIAWRFARGWRRALWMSGLLAAVAYGVAFVLSLHLDQPFGPVMVVCLLMLAMLRWCPRRA